MSKRLLLEVENNLESFVYSFESISELNCSKAIYSTEIGETSGEP
jgi:hypothetical protein